MTCRVCGDSPARFREQQRSTLCAGCVQETPAKVSRERFDAVYWEGQADEVPEATRRAFYEDYLLSGDTLAAYIEDTTAYA